MKKLIFFFVCNFFVFVVHAQITIKTDVQQVAQYALNNSNDYFRVVIKGVTCNRETADDILERDGKRDEIYLTSFSFLVNNNGNTIPSTVIKTRSRTLGDVNARNPEEKRAMAGSAAGALGGIQTGDNFPDTEPWKNDAPPSNNLLPFVLWEGKLQKGGDYAVIHPGIMEWDGPADFLTNFWNNSAAATIIKAVSAVPRGLFESVTGVGGNAGSYNDSDPGVWPAPGVIQDFTSVFYKSNLQALSIEQKKALYANVDRPLDRPIGISYYTLQNNGNSLPYEGAYYNPLQIRLDNLTANKLAERDFGYGKGIIPIKYKDDDRYKGEYILYIAIEKLAAASQLGSFNKVYQDVFDPIANYSFRNVHAADKETDILNGGTVSNTHVVLNDLKGLNSQRWRIKKVNQYYYNITNNYNNLNLDILNKNNINGSNIVTSVNDGTETQQWSFIRYCDGSYVVRNVNTKRVMEVYNAAKNFAAPLGQWDYAGTANQRWFIEK